MNSKIKKVLSVALALAVTITTLPMLGITSQAAGKGYYVTNEHWGYGAFKDYNKEGEHIGEGSQGKIGINDGKNLRTGFCMNYHKPFQPNQYMSRVDPVAKGLLTENQVKDFAVFHEYIYNRMDSSLPKISDRAKFCICQSYFWNVREGFKVTTVSPEVCDESTSARVYNWAENQVKKNRDKFHVGCIFLSNDVDQPVATFWAEKKPEIGYIELIKKSSVSGTSGNSNYSLKGAKYGIYRGGKLIETLVTDANGYAKSGQLSAGSYSVKEIAAPTGFLIDTSSYNVTVTDKSTSTLSVTEEAQKGYIELWKKSAEESVTDGNSNYSLKGARYGIYRGSSKVSELVTNEKGYAKSDALVMGDYTVKEIAAPKGYKIDTRGVNVNVSSSQNGSVTVKDTPKKGWIELNKQSSDSSITNENEHYSLKGAKYGIYKGKTLMDTLVTDENGFAKSKALPLDDYNVKEIEAPKGFRVDVESHGVSVKAPQGSNVSVVDVPYTGWLELQKKDVNPALTKDNPNYSLKGAKYGIYRGDKLIETLVTDEEGKATSGLLGLGEYTVKEMEASKGFALETKSHNITIAADKATELQVNEIPQNYDVDLVLAKIDKETGKAKPEGDATLAGAEFEVAFHADGKESGNATRSWIFRTGKNGEIHFDKEHMIKGDAFYTNTKKNLVLPLGIVTIREIKAPKGYLKNDKVFIYDLKREGNKESCGHMPKSTVPEQVIRGDLEFVKVSDGDLNRLAGVPFKITSKGTGESHIIVTDDNGYASTEAAWQKHTHNTNKGETYEDGIWFGSGKPDDTLGALPFGKYVIEELRCESNKGMDLIQVEANVYRHNNLIKLGTLTDDHIEIETTALEKKMGTHFAKPKKDVVIEDTVSYRNLKAGKTYTVKGVLMDQKSGKPLLENGKKITAEKTFTAKKRNGKVSVLFHFDASSFKGKSVVVFEELYHEDLLLTAHADLEDKDQTIYFPGVKTVALDKKTKEHIAFAGEKVTLTDTISYEGLQAGEIYDVKGVLMNKETGKPVKYHGRKVTNHKSFTADKSEGTLTMTFKLDATKLKNTDVVVFETLSYRGETIANHKDLDDKNQTVHFPEIGTKASDQKTGLHMALAEKTVTLTDKVTYKNLIPGKVYTVSGKLMDKETGKELVIDGKKVKAKKTFTPEKKDGEVSLKFMFDGLALEGKTVVAYETVKMNGMKIATHTDIEDASQTVSIPKVRTLAKDSKSDTHMAKAEKDVTLIDSVSYEGLVPGKTYTIEGTLMDAETQKPLEIDGKGVSVTKIFKAEKDSGVEKVPFTFDGSSLKGKTVVVFEKLLCDDKTIAIHEDLKDSKQTIHFPEVETEAKDEKTEKQISYAEKDVTLIDTVSYKNLVPGKTYSVTGTLMDKETAKPVTVYGKKITKTVSFKPETSEGTVDVPFTFDGRKFKGKEIVVFENLKYKDNALAVHADIEDEKQSITFPEIKTEAKDEKTGGHALKAEEKVTVIDTVSYKGLIPGMEYKVRGQLMDKASGKMLEGSEEVEVIFTPEKADGAVDVKFIFDGLALKGKGVVVFEKLFQGEDVVAKHEDLKDKGQSISFVDIQTEARDKKTGKHIGRAEEKVTLIDTVSYKGLEPGKTYTVEGVLMNKETGKPLQKNGKDVTAQKEFTPEKASGKVEMTFTFDGRNLKGKEVVAFETLKKEKHELAVHADLKDQNQTVSYPDIRTLATERMSGKQTVVEGKKVTLIDMVSYKELIPGATYVVRGTVMDKATGKILKQNKKNIASETTFKAKESNGKVKMVFELDTTGLAEKELVVFETVIDKESGRVVGVHEDLNDKDQTIKVIKHSKPEKPETPKTPPAKNYPQSPQGNRPKTGDMVDMEGLILALMAAGIGTLTVFLRKRNEKAYKKSEK